MAQKWATENNNTKKTRKKDEEKQKMSRLERAEGQIELSPARFFCFSLLTSLFLTYHKAYLVYSRWWPARFHSALF